MRFVEPAFLFAMIALAIPVIIHLFSFRRYKTIMFSNVSFLKEVKEETASRSKLKHLLILLSRLLAIAFLVLAFAQPFIPVKEQQVVTGEKAVSVFLDNSFSMNATENGVASFDRAVSAARDVVNAYDADDKFQIITNDLEGRHQRLVSKEEILSQIDEISISPSSRNLKEVFARQKSILSTSTAQEKSVYFISDFQDNMLEFDNDTSVQLNLIPVSSSNVGNIYIDSVWFLSPVQLIGQPQQVVTKVMNSGSEDAEGLRLTLKINNEIKAIADCKVKANNWTIDTIGFTINESGWNESVVELEDFPITFDDSYYFNFLVKDKINVLEISNQSDKYLSALYNSDQLFDYSKAASGQLNYSGLDENQLLVLNGLDKIPSGLTSALVSYAQSGGNIAVFMPKQADIKSYNDLFRRMNANLIIDRHVGSRAISGINLREGLLQDVFEEIPQNINLPKSSISYNFTNRTQSSGENILTYKDGTPALDKYTLGSGSMYVFNLPLDNKQSDLAVHAIFVPLMYKMAIYSNASSAIAYTLGDKSRINLPQMGSSSENVLRIANDKFEFIPEQQSLGNRVYLSIRDEIKEAGSYRVLDNADQLMSLIAFNFNRKESVMSFASNDDLNARFASENTRLLSDIRTSLGQVIGTLDDGISLWKLCIILALIFLAVEILLIRLMPS
ncbi:MAG: hypothetical protein HKN22_08505 [Bacteroidia bacterium]|nr:hypothetical protein [Bacteroidia bacterium]